MPSTVKLRGFTYTSIRSHKHDVTSRKWDKLRDTSLSVYTNSDLRFEPDFFGMRRRERERIVLFKDAVNFQDVFPSFRKIA